jgi:3-dehydroquinate dehydratase II
MAKILVLQGPNLNLLGQREPELYGHVTLDDIHQGLIAQAEKAGHHCSCFQSNSEGALLDAIGDTLKQPIDYIIINPAALTHTSIALRDALLAVAIPFIEVHLSNIYARETFRHHSYLADIAHGVIGGFGALSYQLAMTAVIEFLSRES